MAAQSFKWLLESARREISLLNYDTSVLNKTAMLIFRAVGLLLKLVFLLALRQLDQLRQHPAKNVEQMSHEQAIAQAELDAYIAAQAEAITPELTSK